MTSPVDNGNRWAVLGLAIFACGCVSMCMDQTPAVALVNESPSLPKGVYVRTGRSEPRSGDTVALPQPPAARAYLGGLGMPARVRLIKRVAGTGGDTACFADGAVTVGVRRVSSLAVDRRGAVLPRWTGCRVLEPDELFLLGDTPGSFDSRYFGPVRRSAVEGVYREVVTW
ncbi:S26 family signal peptidase [soil metagenome]